MCQVTQRICNFLPDVGANQRTEINLFDVNEFNPEFGPLESIPLTENNEQNVVLKDIDATDLDADGTGAITFTLDSDFQGRLVYHGEASLP